MATTTISARVATARKDARHCSVRQRSSRYEATSSRRNRSLSKEVATGAVASVFLGFGSLFLLLSTGVYV